jgi:hypothetical protein
VEMVFRVEAFPEGGGADKATEQAVMTLRSSRTGVISS